MSEILIVKFDYEMGEDKQRWTAYIAGYSIEECTQYLLKIVPNAQINQRSTGFRLDALTDQVRAVINGPYLKTIDNLKREIEVLKSNKQVEVIEKKPEVVEKSVEVEKEVKPKKKTGRPPKKKK